MSITTRPKIMPELVAITVTINDKKMCGKVLHRGECGRAVSTQSVGDWMYVAYKTTGLPRSALAIWFSNLSTHK